MSAAYRGIYSREIVRNVAYLDEPARCIGCCRGMTRRVLLQEDEHMGSWQTPICELCEWKYLNPWFSGDEFRARYERGDDESPATVLPFRLSEAS